MQTFLPWPSFAASASSLDMKRRRSQANECKAILGAILGYHDGWKNHPAVGMWRHHPHALCRYALVMLAHTGDYKGREALEGWFLSEFSHLPATTSGLPPWVGDYDLHHTHRANLVHKELAGKAPAGHYTGQWGELDHCHYLWPYMDGPDRYHLDHSKADKRRIASAAKKEGKSE